MGNSEDPENANIRRAITMVGARIDVFPPHELEHLTIKALRRNREFLSEADAAYSRWKAYNGDCTKRKNLFQVYSRMLNLSRSQQLVVSSLVDWLGYIPEF